MSDARRSEIAKLEALYADNPGGRIFTHLAEAYRKAGDLERAHEVLTEGIQTHPDYSSAHVVLGRVLMDQGELEPARAEFHRVLELDGHNLVALRSLGDIARLEGDTEGALEQYHRLLDLEPSDSDVRDLVDELSEGLVVPGPAEEAGEAEEAEAETETEDEWGELPSLDSVETVGSGEPEEPSETVEELETVGWDLDEAGAADVADGFPEAEAETLDADGEPADEEPADEAWAEAGDLEDEGWSTEAPEVDEDPWAGSAEEEAESDWASEAELEYEPEPEPEAEDWTGALEEEAEAETAPAEAPDDVEDADVMTETIAQVYARQGLYDRAAEVYRELLRTRPDDEGLKERLAEMEAKESEAGEAEAAGAADYEAYGEDGDEISGLETEEVETPAEAFEAEADTTVEGFETVELDTDEASEVAPLAGLEVEETDPETGLAAGDDLADAAFGGDDAEPEPEGTDVEADEAAAAWDNAFGDEPDHGPDDETHPWEDAPVSAPGEAEEAAPEPAAFEAAAEAVEEVVEEVADGDAEAVEVEAVADEDEAVAGVDAEPAEADEASESPWTDAWDEKEAETPYAWGESEDAEDGSAPIGDYLAGLLAFGGGTEAGPAPEAEAEAKDDSGAGPEAAEVPPSPEPGPPSPGSAGGSAGGDEDDDLEMFRSWLESLKQ